MTFALLSETLDQARSTRETVPSLTEAQKILQVIFQIGYGYPARVACLERAVAAALFAARLGLVMEVHFAASVDPINFHAYSAVTGTPVRLSLDEPILGYYYTVHAI